MAIKYLLTCDCGESVSVGVHEAGRQVSCPHCEAQLEVPPLRRLRELPVDESQSVEAVAEWSLRQAVLTASFVIACVCVALGLWQVSTLPEPVTFDQKIWLGNYQAFLDSATPMQLYNQWLSIRVTLASGEFQSLESPLSIAITQQRNRQWTLALVAFCAAVVTLLAGTVAWFSMPGEKQKP